MIIIIMTYYDHNILNILKYLFLTVKLQTITVDTYIILSIIIKVEAVCTVLDVSVIVRFVQYCTNWCYLFVSCILVIQLLISKK